MSSFDADAAMREAMAAHKAGRFPEAEAAYAQVLSVRPEDPKPFYYLGLLHFHKGEAARAIEHMRQCLRYAPNHPHAWNALGAMLIAQGSRSEATQAYRRVTETAPAMGEGWYNFGICLRDEGDIDAAIAAFRTSIARQPDYARSYEALGTLLYQLQRLGEAAQVYDQWSAQDPSNPIARHMAAATSGLAAPFRAGDDYVRRLFDDSAKTFDEDLGRLGYRAPALVAAAVERATEGSMLAEVLDAGCGTGLCGPRLRKSCQRLSGVDLSTQMIERARARGCYDELRVAELCTFMRSSAGRFDAIVSADTLVYFGDLTEPLDAARIALRPGGLLAFTLEGSTAVEYRLEPHGRFTHGEEYVRRSIQKVGLDLRDLTRDVLRRERENDVPGMLVVARRS